MDYGQNRHYSPEKTERGEAIVPSGSSIEHYVSYKDFPDLRDLENLTLPTNQLPIHKQKPGDHPRALFIVYGLG